MQIGLAQRRLHDLLGDALAAGIGSDDDVVDLPIDGGRNEKESVGAALRIAVEANEAYRWPDGEEFGARAELGIEEFPERRALRFVRE